MCFLELILFLYQAGVAILFEPVLTFTLVRGDAAFGEPLGKLLLPV